MASVNNIQKLRNARGWSRPELGKRMGTSGQQVERLEKGQRSLRQEWIDRAAKALEVEPAEIISDRDEDGLDEYTSALQDAQMAVSQLMEVAGFDPADSDFVSATIPSIARAARRAREGGLDDRTAAATLARHMWIEAHPGGQPQ